MKRKKIDVITTPMVIIIGNKKCWHKVDSPYSNVALMTPEQFDAQFKGVDVSKIPNLKVIDLRNYPSLWEEDE